MKPPKTRPSGRKPIQRKGRGRRQSQLAKPPENQQAHRLHEPWRSNALATFVRQARGLKWSRSLLLLLLEELYVGDEFDALVGRPETLPVNRYPEAIAVAIALRHSWRPDDLTAVVQSLGRFARSESGRRGQAPE